jgi:hypothetical protein
MKMYWECRYKHHAMKMYWECRYNSTILDLGTRWRCVVSFTSLPLYPRENSPKYLLDRRLGGPQSKSTEEKNVKPAESRRTPTVQPVAIRITYI